MNLYILILLSVKKNKNADNIKIFFLKLSQSTSWLTDPQKSFFEPLIKGFNELHIMNHWPSLFVLLSSL